MRFLWWSLLKFWVKLAIKLFYRRIEINGVDTYPKEGPVLLAPNHQNAFMDALIPAVFAPKPIHFLVRADVFKPGFADAFLRSLNMMPVYRQRDGINNLNKNDQVFEECFKILREGGTLLIFPEASHLGERRLRPLSKGFTRILFGALEDHDHLHIKVVPLGLNYSSYHESQSRLIVNWGAPLSVSDYYSEYRENPARAMSLLRDDVKMRLIEEIVNIEIPYAERAFDIEMDRFIPFYIQRAGGYTQGNGDMDFYKSREKALQEMKEDHPYFRKLHIYDQEMEHSKLRAPFFYIFRKDDGYWVLQNLFLLAVLPIFALCWLLHAPSYLIIKAMLKKFVRDVQFWSSIKLVGNLILFPLFGLIFAIVAALLSGRPMLVAISVLIFYPLSIFIIRELRLPYRYVLTLWRMLWMRWRKPALCTYLKEIEGSVMMSYKSKKSRFRSERL